MGEQTAHKIPSCGIELEQILRKIARRLMGFTTMRSSILVNKNIA